MTPPLCVLCWSSGGLRRGEPLDQPSPARIMSRDMIGAGVGAPGGQRQEPLQKNGKTGDDLCPLCDPNPIGRL